MSLCHQSMTLVHLFSFRSSSMISAAFLSIRYAPAQRPLAASYRVFVFQCLLPGWKEERRVFERNDEAFFQLFGFPRNQPDLFNKIRSDEADIILENNGKLVVVPDDFLVNEDVHQRAEQGAFRQYTPDILPEILRNPGIVFCGVFRFGDKLVVQSVLFVQQITEVCLACLIPRYAVNNVMSVPGIMMVP